MNPPTPTTPPILIVREPIDAALLRRYAEAWFGDMVKIVVDIDRRVLTLGGELHADGEEVLLDDGAEQQHVWGANVYPFRPRDERLRHTAVMNIRGTRNPSMEVQSERVRQLMSEIVAELLPIGDDP